MKFNLKMIAAVAALVVSGASNAAIVGGGSGDSTLTVLAFNTVTGAFYVRDLGYTLNTFLPTNGGTITQANEVAATFDKTPGAGLTLNSTSNPITFQDASFATWLATTTAADVRWTVIASDALSNTTGDRRREVVSVAQGGALPTITQGVINNGAGNVSSFLTNLGGLTTGTLAGANLTNALGDFVNSTGLLTALDASASLFYLTQAANSGSTPPGNVMQYANATGSAVLKLSSNGNFSYVLAGQDVSAVPLPAAAWLLGAGLMGLGGAARRRKAAAEAA